MIWNCIARSERTTKLAAGFSAGRRGHYLALSARFGIAAATLARSSGGTPKAAPRLRQTS